MTRTLAAVVLAGAFMAMADTTEGAELLEYESLAGGFTNVYAPTVLTYRGVRRMWVGGWATLEEYGRDAIYYTEEVGPNRWTRPVVAFEKPGFHVNDPSVIQHPRHDWLFMYYTQAPVGSTGLGNVIGFASSVDGGRSWTDHGVVIGDWNRLNDCGGWAPSALVRDDEIWLYYHGNSACLGPYRSRLDLNGWLVIDTIRLTMPAFSVNVDVSVQQGRFVMWANDPASERIYRWVSVDGVRFISVDVNPVIVAGGPAVTTPHCEMIAVDECRMYFAFSPSNALDHFESLHCWTFRAGVPSPIDH